MKRGFMVAAAMMLLGTACGGGAQSRTLLVDYSSDQFASFLLANFPSKITVTQGTTLVIHQTWTGEPHTFTGGTEVNAYIAVLAPWLHFFEAFGRLQGAGVPLPDPNAPGNATVADFAKAVNESQPSPARTKLIEALKTLREKDKKIPDLDHPPAQSFKDFGAYVDKVSDPKTDIPQALDKNDVFTQNGGQACYLATGLPPKDANKPCAKSDQEQPEFNGKQSYYSSGIIPYEGAQGNTYRLRLSDDIPPGTYTFFCEVHGPAQKTEVVVKPKGTKIPSQDEVTRQARKEIDVMAEPLVKQFKQASTEGKLTIPSDKPTTVTGPFAGLIGGDHTAVNEFVPKTVRAKAGQPIAWKMMGASHTIAFDVPKYFPQVEFLKDGTVRFNPKLKPPAGGAKKVPEQQLQGGGAVKFDGGTYSGTGFWSSGLIGASPYLEYTMRIAKPGTYRVACLIHPSMVGTVVVTA